jgi:hypothetical protein
MSQWTATASTLPNLRAADRCAFLKLSLDSKIFQPFLSVCAVDISVVPNVQIPNLLIYPKSVVPEPTVLARMSGLTRFARSDSKILFLKKHDSIGGCS